jgi:multifunctional beta-oxidation protein
MGLLLDGKVAVVTGGGDGIGRAHVLALAREGADVLVNDVNADAARAVIEEVKKLGRKAAGNYVSVAEAGAGEAILSTAARRLGGADIVVNNAGITRDKLLVDMTDALWDEVMDVHMKGALSLSRAFLRYYMLAGKSGGSIVLVSSASGLAGNKGQTNYGFAKSGLAGFGKCLVPEGADLGIGVYIVAPLACTKMTDYLPFIKAIPNNTVRLAADKIAPMVVWLATNPDNVPSGTIFTGAANQWATVRYEVSEGIVGNPDGEPFTPAEIGERMKDILFPDEGNARANFPMLPNVGVVAAKPEEAAG